LIAYQVQEIMSSRVSERRACQVLGQARSTQRHILKISEENGYVESFIGKLRDESLNGEIFDTLLGARVVIEDWRREYNQYWPRSSLQ